MIAKRRILLVDDEPDFLTGMRSSLERAGYEVRTADAGQKAWNIVREEKIDLVLLDVNLPDVSGIDVCRRIRMDIHLCTLPVILVTVRTGMSDVLQGFASGATEYLAKPVRQDELLDHVRKLMGGEAQNS